MEYVTDEELDFILNKYHDQSAPFDPFRRFLRNDRIFDPATGKDAGEIEEMILSGDRENAALPRPVRKALAVKTLLENTRILCDPRDPFPALHMIDRTISRLLVHGWKHEIMHDLIPETEAVRARMEREGSVTMWPDFDHSVPLWERVLGLGFPGLLRESEEARDRLAASRPLTEEETGFFDGIRVTYAAVVTLTERLQKLAAATPGCERQARALERLTAGAPSTFYEALLTAYLYFIVSEHIEGLQVRSLSDFDRVFFPFYENDLKSGVPEACVRRDLARFFLQFTAIGNYWNQPVFLGGTRADGQSEINALSYLFLDVYDKMGIYNPKLQIKAGENTPKDFLLRALDMIRRGHSSIVFVGDDTVTRSLIRGGVSPEEARLCNIKGCYEYSARGSMVTEMNYLNLMKPLEYALWGGRDGVTGELCAPATAADFASFEEFFDCYLFHLGSLIDRTVETVNAFEKYLDRMNPQPLLNATYPSCLEKAKDALRGGAVYNDSGLAAGFLASAADSLCNIRKYVFELHFLTLDQLRDALAADFDGQEELRLTLYNDPDKYGNNRPLPDAIADRIVRFVVSRTVGRPNAPERGGKWECGFHVARMVYDQGKKTAASADGRHRGEELSKNISASQGRCRSGVTGAILSAVKTDAASFAGDACVDAMLLPSAVRGEDGLEAIYGLLMTFLRRGGHALQFNVTDPQTLRDARLHPEKHGDLQIRVAGWNVLFNNVAPGEQEAFIRQAEGAS